VQAERSARRPGMSATRVSGPRYRGHSHELIAHKYKMTRSSFIVRTLFDNM